MIEMAQRREPSGGRPGLHRPESELFAPWRENSLLRGAVGARIEIVPATMDHARAIDLRPGDRREIEALGLVPEAGIRLSLDRAMWADAYLCNGEVAALLGCSVSSFLGGHLTPWLVTGNPVARIKKSFAVLARQRIAEMRRRYRFMANYVHADYRESLRFMEWLGFSIDPPGPFGPKRAAFCRIHMGVPYGN